MLARPLARILFLYLIHVLFYFLKEVLLLLSPLESLEDTLVLSNVVSVLAKKLPFSLFVVCPLIC